MRVLIADDDLVLRHSLRRHLEKWSYDVVDCADGVQAWTALQEDDTPSMAILDWNMPGRDGPSLCRDLRQVPTLSEWALIALAGVLAALALLRMRP